MLNLVKVTGRSLQPEYLDGDFVLTSKIPILFGKIQPGDVIVFRHEMYGVLIKIVTRLHRDRDEIFVIGLQEDSVDSRRFGPISFKDVIGKVIWHIQKPGA
jgi:signal peptidase I